ncbi:MAG: hemerythrin family protein [Bradyrhizobium sp.]
MALLQWKANYSIGIDAVDYEHRELIDLINRVHDQWRASGPRPDVEALLGDLYAGISAHFALEERFMREQRYDQLSEHKGDHERLLDDLRDIMEAAERDGLDGALTDRLDHWFSRHFETHDARLHHALGPHH